MAETGSVDKGGSASPAPISATWVSAYNDLDAPGRLKSAKAIRTVFLSDIAFTPKTGISTDYDYVAPAASTSVNSALPGNTQENWVSAIGDGYQMAATVTATLQGTPATTSYHVYITAAYVLNEAGAWLG